MAKRLKLKGAGSGVTVELDDRNGTNAVYKMKPVTLDVEEELDDCSREIDRLAEDPETRPLERLEAIAAQLDVLLTREDAPPGEKPLKPTDLLIPALKAKKVTGMEIKELVREMITAARPT